MVIFLGCVQECLELVRESDRDMFQHVCSVNGNLLFGESQPNNMHEHARGTVRGEQGPSNCLKLLSSDVALQLHDVVVPTVGELGFAPSAVELGRWLRHPVVLEPISLVHDALIRRIRKPAVRCATNPPRIARETRRVLHD